MADEEVVEWVTMRHPTHEKTAPVATATRAAFDEVWKELGWVETKAPAPEKAALDEIRVAPAEAPAKQKQEA